MEWTISVNDILTNDITKINHTLIPPDFHGDVCRMRPAQEFISKLIDWLGEQSSMAQGLNKVITTSEKLRSTEDHILYVLKDKNAKGGKGEAIGFLKVGYKHLYLFDNSDNIIDVEPLCVLDFYVLQNYQRHGYGQVLFNYMLQDMNVMVHELAIDGPSAKMEKFLLKNYGVKQLVRQKNNFAIAPEFFNNADKISKYNRSTPALSPGAGRFTARQPPSSIGTVIHGKEFQNRESTEATPNTEIQALVQPNHALAQAKTQSAQVKNEPTQVEPKIKAEQIQDKLKDSQVDSEPTPERPSTLQVEPSTGSSRALSPAGSASSRRDSQLTDRGYFDVKFYHNKLW